MLKSIKIIDLDGDPVIYLKLYPYLRRYIVVAFSQG